MIYYSDFDKIKLMGACCTVNGTERGGAVNISDLNQKQFINEKTFQNDDCSILVSSYTNELNYNVKYRESGKKNSYLSEISNSKNNKQWFFYGSDLIGIKIVI